MWTYCPECHSEEIVPIIYGNLGYREVSEQDQGKIILGTTSATSDSPSMQCINCHLLFGSIREEMAIAQIETQIQGLDKEERNELLCAIILEDRDNLRREIAVRYITNPKELLKLRLVLSDELLSNIRDRIRQLKTELGE